MSGLYWLFLCKTKTNDLLDLRYFHRNYDTFLEAQAVAERYKEMEEHYILFVNACNPYQLWKRTKDQSEWMLRI